MKIIHCEQRTPEWHKARLGKWTASFFKNCLSAKTLNPLKGAADINTRLAAEIITGESEYEFFGTDATERGKEAEPEILDFLSFTHGYEFARSVGFIDSEKGYGCSPDGVNFDKGYGGEWKTLYNFRHVKYLAEGGLPSDFMMQVQGQMLVAEMEKWIFCLYNPTLPNLVLEIKRDEKVTKLLERELLKNSGIVQEMVEKIREMMK